jgi:hypothetical protein
MLRNLFYNQGNTYYNKTLHLATLSVVLNRINLEQGVRLGDNLQEGELPFFYICDT